MKEVVGFVPIDLAVFVLAFPVSPGVPASFWMVHGEPTAYLIFFLKSSSSTRSPNGFCLFSSPVTKSANGSIPLSIMGDITVSNSMSPINNLT